MTILDQELPRFEQRASGAVAFLSSLVLHVGLLVLLACCMYSVGKPSQGVLLSAASGHSPSATLDLIQTFELESSHVNDPVQAMDSSEFLLDVKIDTPMDLRGHAPASFQLNAALASLSLGDGAGNRSLPGSERGAIFFGTYASGDRFVYVLDSSRSMKGDRWTYACNQLVDSVNSLEPGQEFFIICFDLETSFLFNVAAERAAYVKAEKNTAVRVRHWLRSLTLGDATMPANALRCALEFNPDAVFLLSDGEIQDNSVMMLRRLNGLGGKIRQIPIHTIHLFSAQGRATLQKIARENGGNFTPIENH